MDSTVSAFLPTQYGEFKIFSFPSVEHPNYPDIALVSGELNAQQAILLRMHSECLTGDVFASKRCDCGQQLTASLDFIAKNGGIFIYLRQEGRGIGLHSKIKAYHKQELGMDTVEANTELGFLPDQRDYSAAVNILNYFGIRQVQLLTNNPDKIHALELAGIQIMDRIPLVIASNPYNDHYLKTKRDKMGHLLPHQDL